MRQIKFRAWDESMGRMVFCPTLEYRKDGTVFSSNFDGYGKLVERPLMQFTGLHDANGVEIYEGDIINVYNWGLRKELLGVAIVEWCTDDKGWRHNPALGADDAYDQFRRVEIIGNIHENPELLESQE